ncbi:unnamed protein product [Paramecium pentaurelia]|uniref:Protein kinase domain-containing protein n=1 Tax=Paramecium pentaurelia TaxID=43138 RepID=A0A8S1WXP0_9CILI|nr:unnamed protein product [Paramecium pentaurelia]
MQPQQQIRNSILLTPDFVIIQDTKYEIKVLLDNNAHIQVYQASNIQTKEEVLIKIIDTSQTQELQKYKLMASKKFKNVMNIINFELRKEKLYLAMEFSQKSLLFECQDQFKQNQQSTGYIIRQIANGIKELHNIQLNMQIKPSNIVIQTLTDQFNNQQNIYKLCDYGQYIKQQELLLFYDETQYQAPELTDNNQMQIHQNKVDIWAFGILCLELFNSLIFLREKKIKEITQQDIVQFIQSINCSFQYKRLFEKMLQIDSQQRYNIDQVLQEFKTEHIIKNRSSCQQLIKSQQNLINHQFSCIKINQRQSEQIQNQTMQQFSNMKQIEYVSNFNYKFSQKQLKGLNNG